MKLINNLRLKYKLILILIVPILGMSIFASMVFLNSREESVNADNMSHLIDIATNINHSIDLLRKEQDVTSLFIKSRGKSHGFQLKSSRKKTDASLQTLDKAIATTANYSFNDEFTGRLEQLTKEMSLLAEKREAASNKKFKRRDAETFYGGLIEKMFGLIELMPSLSYNKELANISSAYANFLRLKNYAGQERHILFSVFTRDQFIGKEFNNFTKAVNYQQVYKTNFLALATSEQKNLFEEKIKGSSIDTSETMRQKAFEAADYGAFNINPQEWTIVQDNKIKLLNEVASRLTQDINQKVEATQVSASKVEVLISLFALVALLLTLVFWWVISRGISRSVATISHVMNRVSNGDLNSDVSDSSRDEFGSLLSLLGSMQSDLKKKIDRDAKIAAANARIKEALDNVSANVMVADENNDIIYLNQAAEAMFTSIEKDLSQDIKGFKASEILGSNIDRFHKNPSHQQGLVAQLSSRHEASFKTGGRSMHFVANPVDSEDGQRLGIVVEWQDRTEEVNTEVEIQSIVDALQNGDLDQRVSIAQKSGFFLTLSEGINEMVTEVSNTLNDINKVMSALSHGDLTQTITSHYKGTFGEVASNVNESIEQIAQIVGEIRNSSNEVNNTSREILDGNNSLSARTEHQASALEQTASSMEQITSTVKQNSENAQQANLLAVSAGDLADKGGQVVADAIVAMQEINSSSEKISEIIGVIDEIAFQTNLLALNASVEAARAGEQGRGFAVVATEVRNLAGRSATAAKEIKDLIQDSVHKVDAGSNLVNKSGETLKDIVSGVKKVGDIVGEIAAASQEQTSGIEQVNAAVTSMDESTQQNAALAEQTSAASVSMSDRSGDMSKRLDFFSLGDDWVGTEDTVGQITFHERTMPQSKLDVKTATVPKPNSIAVAEAVKPTSAVSFDDDEWEEF